MVLTPRGDRASKSPSRVLACVAGCAVVALTIAGCGSSAKNSSANNGSASTTAGGSATTASTQDFTLRFSSDVPTNSAAGIEDALFAKKIEEYTNGHVKVTVYPLSQLGAEATVLAGIQTGSIDMADLYTGSVTGELPTLGLYSLPFLVRSETGAAALLNSNVTTGVLSSLGSKQVHGLYIVSNGPFELLAKKFVTTPAEFSGLKLRINTDPISTAMLAAVNATAVPLPSLQVYSALQQGVVSGGITAPAGMVALKWYEVAKYLTELNPQWDMQATVISPSTWSKLPSDYQADIMKAKADVMADNKTTAPTATQTNLTTLKTAGVNFTTPDPAPFRNIESKIYSQFSSSIGQSVITAAENVEANY